MSSVLSLGLLTQHETPIGHRLREHAIMRSEEDSEGFVSNREFFPDANLMMGLAAERRKLTLKPDPRTVI